MSADYTKKLTEDILAKGSPIVMGIDPRPERMPRAYQEQTGTEGIVAFSKRLIELTHDKIVGIKPQIAFFEVFGADGLAAYAEVCAAGRAAGLTVIGDIKRGDIGSTAEAYARAHFAMADALTIHPYLGGDSIEPFLEYCRPRDEKELGTKGVFILTVTSNPSWAEFQGIQSRDGTPLYLHVAAAVRHWNISCIQEGDAYGPVGAVVGATHPEVLASVRKELPRAFILAPGVGAQGGKIADLAPGFDANGLGMLLPISRALTNCYDPDDADWEGKVRESGEGFLSEVQSSVKALRR